MHDTRSPASRPAWPPPQAAWLAGGRLHLQQGPIDLVIGLDGAGREAGFIAAQARFATVLRELTEELPVLRRAIHPDASCPLDGAVARRMWRAAKPHASVFITPMAAVAGAVADEVLDAVLTSAPNLSCAYVNNGGDIAIRVAPGEVLTIGIAPGQGDAGIAGAITVRGEHAIGGIATSGWRGRSFSLGIADAVTVLAASAAAADAAATIIANAVNAEHPAIERQAAQRLDPDSDLGGMPVTTAVGSLPPHVIDQALRSGVAIARKLQAEGLIRAAALALAGSWRSTDEFALFSSQRAPYNRG